MTLRMLTDDSSINLSFMAPVNGILMHTFPHPLGLELEWINQDTHTSEDSIWMVSLNKCPIIMIIISECKVHC